MTLDDWLELRLAPTFLSSPEIYLHVEAPQQNSTQQDVEIPVEQRSSVHGSTQHGIVPQEPFFTLLPPPPRPPEAFYLFPIVFPEPRPPLYVTTHPVLPLPTHVAPSPLPQQPALPLTPPPPEPPQPIRQRRKTGRPLGNDKNVNINPPYPWATDRRAIVHSIEWLQSRSIDKIKGSVKCKHCARQYEMEYDLRTKFGEVSLFICRNKHLMHRRAPKGWMAPEFPDCPYCKKKKCIEPVIGKKREINWLFLLLGQMLGCCTLDELRYFCKHNRKHRTAAKDRVLFVTYMVLSQQLDPRGPFDVSG